MKLMQKILLQQSNAFYFNVGAVVLCSLVVLYMYFLSMSVVHVVLRKEVMQKMGSVESQIAALEASYINSQHQVSNKMAALESFTQNDDKIFINRGESTLVFAGTGR
jgi:hypothetical protein